MPSGAYGRGGGNFVKKPKFPQPALSSDTSAKSSSLKSNEKVSLLKKIVHAMPGSQSNKSQSRTSAGSQPHRDTGRDIPTRHTNTHPRQKQTRGSTLPARPKTSPSHPSAPSRISFADDASYPVMDTTHRNGRTTAVNLHTLTPGSSEAECSNDLEHSRSVRPLSPNGILPFTSARQMRTDSEGTAVNEGPFSAEVLPGTFKAPPLTATRNRVRARSSSLNDGFLKRTVPSQPPPSPQPEREVEDSNRNGDQKKALAALEGNLGSATRNGEENGKRNANHRPVINDSKYKREHRITLATPTTTISRIPPAPTPARRPISELGSFTDMLPSNLNEHTRRWSENISIVSGSGPAAAPSDPFNHLFTSCVISLILIIVLAAGKDILYVIALLPVLMTLAKHFLDLNQLQLGLYTPLMRKNLESLLSI